MAVSASSLQDVFEHCRDMDASLAVRLATFADAARRMYPSLTAAADRLVGRLERTGAGKDAPKPGDPMPPFVLPDESGHLVSLEELLTKGPVAVTFHRGHWCPYCRININALAKAHQEIAPAGGQIVAIMPEREQFAAEFKSEGHAAFPVLTDMDNGYAMSLNLAVWLGEEMEQLMRDRLDRDIPYFQGNQSWILPIPATFIVGRDGKVKTRFIDPDYRRRMAIEDLLAALRAEI